MGLCRGSGAGYSHLNPDSSIVLAGDRSLINSVGKVHVGKEKIEIELRLFNSLGRYGRGGALFVPKNATVREVVDTLAIPRHEIYVSWLNGHNIMESLGGSMEAEHALEAGDVLALSGLVPFSRSYGTPVC